MIEFREITRENFDECLFLEVSENRKILSLQQHSL
jgi:uncharacterized protein YuzE